MAEGCGNSRTRMVQKKPGVPVPVVMEGTSERCPALGCAGQRRDESSRVSPGRQEAAGRNILRTGTDGPSQASSHTKCLVRRDHTDRTALRPLPGNHSHGATLSPVININSSSKAARWNPSTLTVVAPWDYVRFEPHRSQEEHRFLKRTLAADESSLEVGT